MSELVAAVFFSHSVVFNSATPRIAALQASLSFIITQSLLRLMSIKSVMPFNSIIPCALLILLPSIFPNWSLSVSQLFTHKWPMYWSFSFRISPSNEYSGLIFFWIDWFDLRAVQGTLRHLLKHHHLKASFLRCSAFFMVQFSHHMHFSHTGKIITLAIWTLLAKCCLCFLTPCLGIS